MNSLIRLFAKNGILIFFILLQTLAIILIFRKNSMQQTFIAAKSSALAASIYSYINEGTDYLKLKKINEELLSHNKILLSELYKVDSPNESNSVKIKKYNDNEQSYTFIDADIIFNSITRSENYFTINRGKNHGVSTEMGVISPRGVLGIVINTTDNYALVQSILSTEKIKISVAIKNSGYFGTLSWKGEDSRIMNLSDIPKYVDIKLGDTIITDGKSSIFPKGIMIGKIADFEVDSKTGFWDISVELNEKMGIIQKVFVVNNLRRKEIKQIQRVFNNSLK